MAPRYKPRPLPARLVEKYRRNGSTTDETMGVVLERAASRFPDHEAVVDLSEGAPRRYTYSEAQAIVARFATFLRREGIRPGDLVLVQAPNAAAVVFACWAAWQVGAVVNPVVDIYRSYELRHILTQAQPDAIVGVLEHRGFEHAAAFDELAGELDLDLKSRVLLGEGSRPGWTSWTEAIANDGSQAAVEQVHPDEPTLILFTSGTTSLPKGAVHSHRTLIAETLQMANAWGMGPRDRTHHPRPIAHIAGVLFALTVPVYRGGTLVLSRVVNVPETITEIVEHGITTAAVPPQSLEMLRDAYETAGVTSIPLRNLVSGGTNVPRVLIEAVEALGIKPARIYGMTELPTVTMPSDQDTQRQRLDTDGVIAPDCECEAVDPETRAPVPRGAEGELRVRGPERMLAYLDEEQTRAQIDDQGWFYTGDLGVVDEDGCVSVTGRIKDIINRGGEKFSTREIEDILVGHPEVEQVAVVAAPNRRYGEVPAAFVVPRGADPPDEEELVGALRRANVATQKTPVHWFFVDELPITSAGKVKKFELASQIPLQGPGG